MKRIIVLAAAFILLSSAASAALVIPGADGSDGVFSPTSNIEVDLSQAVTANWDTPSSQPGKGVSSPSRP